MKDRALQAALRFDDPGRRLNALREYLQGFILRSLHESEASRAIVFVGGTALRFLEDLPRFSEDLDFSRISLDGYDPVRWLDKLKRDIHLAGFDSAVRWIDREPVQVAWIRTASLLVEAGLSGHPEQKLSIKVEIDTRPPAGATVLRSVITRHFTFVIAHHDLPSLMAGKLHALLTRPLAEGPGLVRPRVVPVASPPRRTEPAVPPACPGSDPGRRAPPGGGLAPPASDAAGRGADRRADPRRRALPRAAGRRGAPGTRQSRRRARGRCGAARAIDLSYELTPPRTGTPRLEPRNRNW